MSEAPKRGRELLEKIEQTDARTPTLWFLGHCGFAIKYLRTIFYLDPMLSRDGAPFRGADVSHADLVLCTHAHAGHLDPGTVRGILASSRRAKVVLPIRAAEAAHSQGIEYHRMVTTNSDLRVEFRDDRIYAVPSAHPQLDWTPLGGYPYLGYLVRFGNWTVYHPGDCIPYEGLAERLKPYTVNVALLPVNGRPSNFEIAEAAQLAAAIGAEWLAPMHGDAARQERFIEHMLCSHPEQRFKVFQVGERWALPHGDAAQAF